MSNIDMMPKIQIQLIAIGRNEIKLSSNLPNEMVKNAKTRKLHKYNTVLKSVESTLNSDFEKLSESNTNEFPLVRVLETSRFFRELCKGP